MIYGRVNILISLLVTIGVSGIIMLIIPFFYFVLIILTLFVIQGVHFGVSEGSINIYLIHLWGKEVTPFMQGLHFCFGLGELNIIL